MSGSLPPPFANPRRVPAFLVAHTKGDLLLLLDESGASETEGTASEGAEKLLFERARRKFHSMENIDQNKRARDYLRC
jgi:hypothetical protein